MDSDFAGSLGDGHDHRIGDADGCHEECDRSDASENQLYEARRLFHFLAHVVA